MQSRQAAEQNDEVSVIHYELEKSRARVDDLTLTLNHMSADFQNNEAKLYDRERELNGFRESNHLLQVETEDFNRRVDMQISENMTLRKANDMEKFKAEDLNVNLSEYQRRIAEKESDVGVLRKDLDSQTYNIKKVQEDNFLLSQEIGAMSSHANVLQK